MRKILIIDFLFIILFTKITVSTAEDDNHEPNTLYIPEVREMEVITYFESRVGLDLSGVEHDFMKFDLTIGETTVKYHFGHNKEIGRCDIVLLDHFKLEEIFKIDLTLGIKVYTVNGATEKIIAQSDVSVKANPNSYEEIYKNEGDDYKITVKFRLICDTDFESINCAFNKKDSETTDLKRDPYTGEWVCKNSDTCFASKLCDQSDTDPCQNGGVCKKNDLEPGVLYCECQDGFVGETCQITTPPLTEEIMLFAPPDELPLAVSANNCTNCPKNQCDLIETFEICTAKEDGQDSFECTGECQHVCGEKYCRNKKEDTITYFLKELRTDPSSS